MGVLQQEEDVKSRNHSVPFESDSIKQQRGVPNHRQQTIKFTWGNGQMANFVQVQPSECLEYDRPTLREALLLAKGLFVLMSMKQDTSIFNLLKCLLTSAYLTTIYTITRSNEKWLCADERRMDTQQHRFTLDKRARSERARSVTQEINLR